jgi:hypothetical protein
MNLGIVEFRVGQKEACKRERGAPRGSIPEFGGIFLTRLSGTEIKTAQQSVHLNIQLQRFSLSHAVVEVIQKSDL